MVSAASIRAARRRSRRAVSTAAFRLATSLLIVGALSAPPIFAHLGVDAQILELDRRIEAEPKNAELYLQRGELHRIHREWKLASKDYSQARRLDPKLDAALLALGTMLQESGKPKRALKPLTRFLDANPDHIRAHVARARAHRDLKRHRAAITDYDRAIQLSTAERSRPEYFLERARATAALGTDHYREAIEGLDEGLQALGRPVTLELLAIDLLLELAAWDGAIARVDAIASQARRNEMWLIRRGEIEEQAGRPEAASTSYRQALESIEALPETRRNNRAVQRLEAQARSSLERLGSASLQR